MSEIQEVNEGRRQRYLAALGLPLWTTRHDLPGARAANPLSFVAFVDEDFAESAPATPSFVEPVIAVPAVVVQAAQEVRRVDVAPPVTPAFAQKNDATAVAVKTAVADANFPRFSCRVQPLAPGWVGVIALDDVPDLSAQEHRLLDNLMQALGGDMAMAGVREHFRWPMSPNPAIPRDAAAAREALAAFLGRRRESARWLVLGETLGVYVRTALPQQTVIAAPTLRELLESPAAKRALWQALHG